MLTRYLNHESNVCSTSDRARIGRREAHNFHCWTKESLYYGAVGLSKEKKKSQLKGTRRSYGFVLLRLCTVPMCAEGIDTARDYAELPISRLPIDLKVGM